MSGMTSTASPQQTPGLPENMDVIAFEGFEGINTQFRRLSTPPNQLWWCDGFMPFAKNRLRAMPSNSASVSADTECAAAHGCAARVDATAAIAVHRPRPGARRRKGEEGSFRKAVGFDMRAA